ncbi:MAG: hypothetical protein Satyrvirus12_10 [Satyrvirus sp.]|uniref:Uncharacterized protein n=1 Tax=Satyrvirus sp. TaxID=2487771 RepID=A0A3G5ADR1_9VIRU|nr:MAG: hypothetical protein Satyrvirus12_10 [Satyrvirus sp.]
MDAQQCEHTYMYDTITHKCWRRKKDGSNFCWLHQKQSEYNRYVCKDKYINFTNDPNLKELGDCYKQVENLFVSTQKNPIKYDENCQLINLRKHSYYIHTYDPNNIIENIKKNKLPDGYLPNIISKFNLQKRQNCCNCISIVLYYESKFFINIHNLFIDTDDFDNLAYKYLPSIKKTIINVKKNLSDWLVRIYMDPNILNILKILTDLENYLSPNNFKIYLYIKHLMDYIFSAENVEIYTLVCQSIVKDESFQISLTRSFRFLAMVDESVNVCVIREADGIVSNLDCCNIKLFANSDRIFYFPCLKGIINIEKKIDQNKHYILSYAKWLNIYKENYESDFFRKQNNICDLLAGLFAIKLTLNKDIFLKYAINISEQIRKHNINQVLLGDDITNGFDEILLLDIFKEIISVPFEIIDTNKYKYNDSFESVENMIYYHNNVEIINIKEDYKNSDIKSLLDELKSKNYIDIDKNDQTITSELAKVVTNFKCLMKLKEGEINMVRKVYLLDKIFIDNKPKKIVYINMGKHPNTILQNTPYICYSDLDNDLDENELLYRKAGIKVDPKLKERLSKVRGGYYDKYQKYKSKYILLRSLHWEENGFL